MRLLVVDDFSYHGGSLGSNCCTGVYIVLFVSMMIEAPIAMNLMGVGATWFSLLSASRIACRFITGVLITG